MSLGRILAEKRKAMNLTQEQLAEKLSVSRSAVAKWEADKGMPDIDNIKALSKELDISIDMLLSNKQIDNEQEELNDDCISKKDEKIQKFIFKKCRVELTDWNDGISDGYLLSQDSEFIYYLIPEKKKNIVGMLAKKFVLEIKLSDETVKNILI